MGEIIRFNTLTGLRPNEAIAAIRLLNREFITNSDLRKSYRAPL
jgi:hypothetical protein